MKNANHAQHLLVKATSILGVAGVSLLLSLPVMAQASNDGAPSSSDMQPEMDSNSASANEDASQSGEYIRDVGGSRYTDRSTNLSNSNIANRDTMNQGASVSQNSNQSTDRNSVQEPAGQTRVQESLQNPSPDSSDGSATQGDGAQRDQRNPQTNPNVQAPNRSSQAPGPGTSEPQAAPTGGSQAVPNQNYPTSNPGAVQQQQPSSVDQQSPSGVDNTTTQPSGSGAGTGTVPGLW